MPPRILPRPEHTVSRKDIDADALKVLYRLKNHGFRAYLVGGGVRDLLLARKPKDFDIATSAHPQQVKKLFRNCFIIGRRFRLCHVRFGKKVVEVSTFRRQAPPEDGETLIRRDNTFGTPEEDAFRRDFTVNALFYDIANFSVIDFVGGLEDLEARTIRTIGDAAVRFREDPVRMLRAVALAARLGFTIDRDTLEAIRFLRGEIVKSSPARILEEIYKILRQGASRQTFRLLHELGLLAYLLPEAEAALAKDGEHLLGSLSRLDDYRNAGLAAPEDLTAPLLMGSLLVPLGLPIRRAAHAARAPDEEDEEPAEKEQVFDVAGELEELGGPAIEEDPLPAPGPPPILLLPFARRDADRLRLILAAQNRLREVDTSARIKRYLAGKGYLEEALRWMEIHGGVQGRELAGHWRRVDHRHADEQDSEPPEPHEHRPAKGPRAARRRRRRRTRRPRSTPPNTGSP
jgi:poly(A) polymerase